MNFHTFEPYTDSDLVKFEFYLETRKDLQRVGDRIPLNYRTCTEKQFQNYFGDAATAEALPQI